MNTAQHEINLLNCCVCTEQIDVVNDVYTCMTCNKKCHVACMKTSNLTALWDWQCDECITCTPPYTSAVNDTCLMEPVRTELIPNTYGITDTKPHKCNKLELFKREETRRPLLNNKDLDPDRNYFLDILSECEYYGPSQLTHKFNKDANSFAIMHLNCRIITLKLNEIELLLNQLPACVLAVTETWLTEATADTIRIPGFKFVYKNRVCGRGGGMGFLGRTLSLLN